MAGRRKLNRQFDADIARRRVIRKASFYAVFFGFAGVFIAIAGAALVAWLLSMGGLPFVRTWLVVTAVVIIAGIALVVWNGRRERTRMSKRGEETK